MGGHLKPINCHFRDCEARCSGSPCKLRYIRIRPLPLPLKQVFGRLFVKRFARCYRSIVLSVCLSVTLVYCGQMVGRINTKPGVQVGLGCGHTVLDGDPPPLL